MSGEHDVQRVADVMARQVITVAPDEQIADVVTRFVDNWIDGAPVVTADGRVVGMITDGDLVRALAETGIGYSVAFAEPRGDRAPAGEGSGTGTGSSEAPSPEPEVTDGDRVEERLYRLATRRVSELMTPNVITIHEDAPLAEAAELMSEHLIKKLPVVREGRLVGLISRSDIVLRTLARVSSELVALREAHDGGRSD